MAKSADQAKACAVLSHLIVGIVWFFADKDLKKNRFAKFHVKQALVFLIGVLILNVAVEIFSWISHGFGSVLGYIVYALMTILWILAIVFAASGQENDLMIFGPFTKLLDF